PHSYLRADDIASLVRRRNEGYQTAGRCVREAHALEKASRNPRQGELMAEADELRRNVAISCRILGMLGLVSGTTGHVSARIPGTEEMWIRCRGGAELGLIFTGVHNVRRVNFDGDGPGMDDKHAKPNETAIHGEIYR